MSYASVGMMYPVFAPLVSHTEGQMPTYGTGVILSEAREITVNKTYNNNPLDGDDRVVDDDNGLTGLGYEFENTGLNDEQRQVVFGEETNANTATGGQWESDNETPYGGFAYIRRMRADNGDRTFEVWLALKIKFQDTQQVAKTKSGNQIEWGTPKLSGNAAALDVDGSGKLRFRLHKTFTSASAAKSWINTILNVNAVTT